MSEVVSKVSMGKKIQVYISLVEVKHVDSSSTLYFGISLLKMMLDYLTCSILFTLYVLVEFPFYDASILDDEG